MPLSVDSKTPLEQIDPEWAWLPWEPSAADPWNDARVRLLFRRGGFGIAREELRQTSQRDVNVAVATLFGEAGPNHETRRSSFEKDSESLASAVRAGGDVDSLAAWWLHRMVHTPSPIVEKMTLFWHGHFATGAEKVMDAELMFGQNRLLRKYALADVRPMVHEISKDPAMLIYLDSISNRKAHPNENYARELMELFCLGEGNYTERDVQELARCFTGWEIRRKMFRFNPYQHDDGMKSILGKASIESGEEAIDVVLAQKAMPEFICRKLFRYLICDEPSPPEATIAPLAARLVASNYEIRPVVEMILKSNLMLSMWSLGKKVRSPVELAVEWMRSLSISTNMDRVVKSLKPLGQALFYPPNVKGWDGGRAWINSSTLIGRANFVVDLISDENTRFGGKSLDAWTKEQSLANDDAWREWLNDALLAIPLNATERTQQANLSKRDVLIAIARNPKLHLS